jgi:hypothetical protein
MNMLATVGRHRSVMRAAPAPRQLSDGERAVVRAVLVHADFDGRDTLLADVDTARVVGRCGCGCASVDLRVPGDKNDAPAYPIPNEATVLDQDGNDVGGVLVFAGDGHLRQLEIYSYAPDPIREMPDVEYLRFSP